jgi:hypothetical protein
MSVADTEAPAQQRPRQKTAPKASSQASPAMNDAALMARRAELEEQRTHLPADPEDDALVMELRERAARKRQEADAIDSQIAEIDATIGAQERHRRQQTEQTRQTQLAAAKQALAEAWSERQQAMADFEAGTRQAAASLVRVTELDKKVLALGAKLGGKFSALSEMEGPRRYSGRFAAVMSAAAHRFRIRFGCIDWPNSSLFSATKPWVEDEERLSQNVLKQLMEKE